MGRAKRVLAKLEEKTRANGMHKLVQAAQKQSTQQAVDVTSMPAIIQPGTIIHDVGIVTDTDVRYDGQSVQVTYKVSGSTTALGSSGYVASASESVPATRSMSPIENEAYMKLRIKDVLRSDQYRESTLIQRVLSDDTCDISTLVDVLTMCESTLQSLYALTRIAGEMDELDYKRFLQSLRTLIVDESGVELDAHYPSTPLDDNDGRGSMLGDGLLKIYEKNGSTDHMDGLTQNAQQIRVICKHCHAGQLFDNGMCKLCGNYLPYPAQYAQEMYGAFSDPQQTCTNCGATIEDKAYTCRRCGVSVYSSPVIDVSGFIPITMNGTPLYNTETHKACAQCGAIHTVDVTCCRRCGYTGFLTPVDSLETHPNVRCIACGHEQTLGWLKCFQCGNAAPIDRPANTISPMDKVDIRL